MKVSKLVNFVVESAALLQVGTTKSLLNKFEQRWGKKRRQERREVLKDGESGKNATDTKEEEWAKKE